MSPPLTYGPAYLGLFISLLLAATCNAFLDIQYGGFGIEVAVWSVVFAGTLWLGWRQRGRTSPAGRKAQRWMMALAMLASLLLILPIWGLPRGAIYVLAALQASQNCVTTTRRDLYRGLLVAAVMVMFAAAHFRADWTLLFYLIPFVVAVVFTLAAEQISHRIQELNAQSLGHGATGGPGVAILTATTAILAIAALLHAVTPQFSWSPPGWDHGVPAAAGSGDADSAEGGGAGSTAGSAVYGGVTPAEMRAAAGRDGMPAWQARAIHRLADLAEAAGELVAAVRSIGKVGGEWLRANKADVVRTIAAAALLALAIALWRLLREARLDIWLRTRLDYVRFARIGWHARGNAGVVQLYEAMQRLFAWQGLPRHPQLNAREYLARLSAARGDLRPTLVEMTRLFEDARYGGPAAGDEACRRMRGLYTLLFRNMY